MQLPIELGGVAALDGHVDENPVDPKIEQMAQGSKKMLVIYGFPIKVGRGADLDEDDIGTGGTIEQLRLERPGGDVDWSE
ncbi:hypothetical protein V5F89_13630 [Pelagerythrobacter marensis]|uniref:Uncharacterized protein n=1 Tax=Pelagerythrobacter marensis TaxID=543877 RepID=A0ABZ2D651_9SPHN